MSDIATFDTRTDSAVELESPLAFSLQHRTVPAATPASRVAMRERAFLGHLILRGSAAVLGDAVKAVTGIEMSSTPQGLAWDASGERSLQWLSPDEWLLIVPDGEAFDQETQLREQLGNAHFAITEVSGGQTLLELDGDAARELLMKSVIYDVNPEHFPVGKGVTTVFAKATVIIRRPSESRWELVVRRSFADYIYRWLLDAGNEYAIGVVR